MKKDEVITADDLDLELGTEVKDERVVERVTKDSEDLEKEEPKVTADMLDEAIVETIKSEVVETVEEQSVPVIHESVDKVVGQESSVAPNSQDNDTQITFDTPIETSTMQQQPKNKNKMTRNILLGLLAVLVLVGGGYGLFQVFYKEDISVFDYVSFATVGLEGDAEIVMELSDKKNDSIIKRPFLLY